MIWIGLQVYYNGDGDGDWKFRLFIFLCCGVMVSNRCGMRVRLAAWNGFTREVTATRRRDGNVFREESSTGNINIFWLCT